MSKKIKSKTPKVDPYVDGLMAKLLERLISLERKMDSVVSHVVPQVPVQSVRRERMMYEAICADCNKVCEVPFKPTEDRAVYCKSCWALRKSGASSRPGMSVLRPVFLTPKPASQLSATAQAAAQAKEEPKRTQKKTSAKKKKKKKK